MPALVHPRTGLTAIGVLPSGRIVWPVMGAAEEPPTDPPEPEEPATPPTEPAKPAASAPEETDWKAEARKWEQRAKENHGKAKKLDELEQANATELEKAQKAAEENEARARAATERAVKAEVRALADGFEDRTDAVLRLGDLTRFVDDDGEIDDKAIVKELDAVLKAAPHLAKQEPTPTVPPKPGQRPTERLRPGAVPAEPERARSLAEAVAAHYQT